MGWRRQSAGDYSRDSRYQTFVVLMFLPQWEARVEVRHQGTCGVHMMGSLVLSIPLLPDD